MIKVNVLTGAVREACDETPREEVEVQNGTDVGNLLSTHVKYSSPSRSLSASAEMAVNHHRAVDRSPGDGDGRLHPAGSRRLNKGMTGRECSSSPVRQRGSSSAGAERPSSPHPKSGRIDDQQGYGFTIVWDWNGTLCDDRQFLRTRLGRRWSTRDSVLRNSS